jgi:F0F1-type ATP synthase delta subunit
MGDCLKDCLADSNKTNIKQFFKEIMKHATIIMLLMNPGTIAKIQTKKDFTEIFSEIDNFMKVLYKILTKYKFLDSKTYINQIELVRECLKKCNISNNDNQKIMIILAHMLANKEFQKIAKAELKIFSNKKVKDAYLKHF